LTEKLDALRQYLKENMQKKFIKELQSSAEYSILFVSKLNESLKLCVNYRALNNIMIKKQLFIIAHSRTAEQIAECTVIYEIQYT